MRIITRTVWILSLISLFTDLSSEMLYPVLPVYLKTIGFSVLFIGILESIAEATSGFFKGYFGKYSDLTGKRTPFVQFGYALSAISKPLFAFFVNPLWVFFARTLDRFGKGIRTGARDAMLSDEATAATKGRVFGLHRAMDTLGAVFGPALALIFLLFRPNDYKTLFLIAFIPGLMAILSSMLLKDKTLIKKTDFRKPKLIAFLGYWKTSPVMYKKVVVGLLAFALFNSSDMLLLLKAKEAGLNDTYVIGFYIFYNLIYALSSYPIGVIADKIELKKVFIFGLIMFSIVYTGMAFNDNIYVFFALFFIYGLYAAATEGISKAWISNITHKNDTATAIGTFAGFQSIAALFASSFAGVLWFSFGAEVAFLSTAGVTILVIIYFMTQIKPKSITQIENEII